VLGIAPILAKKTASVLISHEHYNNTGFSDIDMKAADDSDDFATDITNCFKPRRDLRLTACSRSLLHSK